MDAFSLSCVAPFRAVLQYIVLQRDQMCPAVNGRFGHGFIHVEQELVKAVWSWCQTQLPKLLADCYSVHCMSNHLAGCCTTVDRQAFHICWSVTLGA